jgi:two-component system, chemotaxis family, response regulator Rcp1
MKTIAGRPARILVVEDNPGDVRLIREALLAGGIGHQLSVVGDGEAALEFLRHQGAHAAALRPDLVLLDLNLPRLDGRAVLRAIKDDEALQRIPVVVFTTSSSHQDIAASYGLRANAVVTKPIDLDAFIATVNAIEEFCFGAALLPARC